VIVAAAWSISRRSSADNSSVGAPMFSRKLAALRVPGMGTIHGRRASSQARAIWAGVARCRVAIRASRSTTADPV
jgi:hypothetical protein